jgi:hypothetical protein
VFEAFEFNDFLLGLVLGYGRSNSEYYCRRNALAEYLKTPLFFDVLPRIPHPRTCHMASIAFYFLDDYKRYTKAPTTKEGFSSLGAEWEWIKRVEWSLDNCQKPMPPYRLDYPRLPFYICRHGGDSEQLRERYIKARNRLANLFYNRSSTEAVLREASRSMTPKRAKVRIHKHDASPNSHLLTETVVDSR